MDQGDIDDEEVNHSFPTGTYMSEHFTGAQIKKTLDIASRCNLELELGKWIFPPLTLKKGVTPEQELLRLANEGLAYRGMKDTPEVRERINYEHKIITDKGFAPYFLVVADLLRFAREHGILATTRGSAGGSLISYLTGVTTIDPLAYKLPFERFLNPERPKAPDIDMDFADNRRDEVIEYARQNTEMTVWHKLVPSALCSRAGSCAMSHAPWATPMALATASPKKYPSARKDSP